MQSPTLTNTETQSKPPVLTDLEAHRLGEKPAEPPKFPLITPEEVTIIIPTLNEHEAIESVIDELKGEGFDNILVVDGYSEDETIKLAKERGVTVLHQRGSGKAGALETAVQYVNTPFMLVMDGDGTYRPSDIERLLDHANDYDEVIGARRGDRGSVSRLHKFGNEVISGFFGWMFSVPITDVLSGMYLLRTKVAKELHFATTSFDVEVEIASQIASEYRITQVPIGYRKRVGKQKLSSFKDGTKIFRTMLWMAHYYNPVILVGGLISLLVIPATIIFAWVAYSAMLLGVWHAGYALFSGMLFLIATQAASVALISLLIRRSEARLRLLVRR